MLPTFPPFQYDGKSKTAAIAALRARHALDEFAAKARATLAAPSAVSNEDLTPSGLRSARRERGAELVAEFDRDHAGHAASARGEHAAIVARTDRAVEEHFAKAGSLKVERARISVSMLAALPLGDPALTQFFADVRAGKEDAVLAGLLAPSFTPIGKATAVAREVLCKDLPPIMGQRADGIQHFPDVKLHEAEQMAHAASELVAAQAELTRAALVQVAQTGKFADDITGASSADLMVLGSRLDPLVTRARELGLIAPHPQAVAKAEAKTRDNATWKERIDNNGMTVSGGYLAAGGAA